MWRPPSCRADSYQVRDVPQQQRLELVAQRCQARCLGGLLGCRQAGCATEGDRTGDILGARPDAVLLPAAMNDRFNQPAIPNDQRADALGCAKLVTRQGKQGYGEMPEVDRDLSERLHAVGVQGHARGRTSCRDLRHRLDGANLIVDPHDRDDGGLAGKSCLERLELQ